MKKKGFTLIELLAVIIILGILLLIAIPGVTRYVGDSRKESYIATAKQLINGARVMVNSGKMNVYDMDATYYIPTTCVKTETANRSPYGDFDKAYIVVTYDNDSFDYYWVSRDVEGMGVRNITKEYDLTTEKIESNIKADEIKTSTLVEGKLITIVLENDCKNVKVIDPIVERLEERQNDGVLRVNRYSTSDVFGKNIEREKFEKIITVNHTNVPSNAIDSWDASIQGNGSIMVWYTDEDNNGLFELYLGQKNDVLANENSSYLFAGFINVTKIDLTHFDATNVKDMSHMFHNDLKLETLIIPRNINTINAENMSYMFYQCESLKNLDLRGFNTARVTDMKYMFAYSLNLQSVNLSSFNTSNTTDMSYMFFKNNKLETINLSSFDTSKVTTFSNMFYDCNNVTSIEGAIDTRNATTLQSMFDRCFKLKNINLTKFNTSKVRNMSYLFSNCNNLESIDVSHFDTSNVTTFFSMFEGVRKAPVIDVSHFNTSNATNFGYMFRYCENIDNLDLSNFNTSNATSMWGMFEGTKKLKSIDVSGFDTRKVTNMDSMFRYMESLESLDISMFNTSNVTNMADMFYNDVKLRSLNLNNIDTSKVTSLSYTFAYMPIEVLDISDFDTRNVTNMNATFYDMRNLKTIVTGPNFNTSKVTKWGLAFDECPSLKFDFKKLDLSNADEMHRAFGMCSNEILDLSNATTPKLTDTMGMFSSVKSKQIRLDNMDFSKVEYHGGNPYKNGSVNIKMFWNLANDTVIYVKDQNAKSFIEARLAEAGKTNQVIIVN